MFSIGRRVTLENQPLDASRLPTSRNSMLSRWLPTAQCDTRTFLWQQRECCSDGAPYRSQSDRNLTEREIDRTVLDQPDLFLSCSPKMLAVRLQMNLIYLPLYFRAISLNSMRLSAVLWPSTSSSSFASRLSTGKRRCWCVNCLCKSLLPLAIHLQAILKSPLNYFRIIR